MTEETKPPVRLRYIGTSLRGLRDEAFLTQRTASRRMERSAASLSLIEQGRQTLRVRDLKHILDVYGLAETAPLRLQLLELCRQQNEKGWWSAFKDRISPTGREMASLEWHSAQLDAVTTDFIPGLFQTEDYAHAIMNTSMQEATRKNADHFVGFRLGRQQVLHKDDPPVIRQIIDEVALRRTRGGVRVMREQLLMLNSQSHRENVSVRVLPFSSPSSAIANSSASALSIGRPAFIRLVLVNYLGGRLMVENESACASFDQAFEHACDLVLSETKSRDLIHRIASEL